MLDLDQLLAYAVERNASDVHLKVGSPPFIRIDGHLEKIDHASVSPVETERIAFAIMPKQRAEEFIATSDADFAYSVSGVGRFRVNAMRQRGSVGLVLRRVQSDIPSFEDLGLPPVVRKLAEHERGLVLVTGPTGSGKTTTLGSMIDYINTHQHKHIVTIEDPIEILHADKASIVNQREVGTDTSDFHSALKRVLRQDPDVILVGEMRDIETVKTALTAAETGHLVFSTVHTVDAAETVNRLIDFFPPHMHQQVRAMLAGTLKGIISQRLVPSASGGRVAACEILRMTGRVRDMIMDHEQTGRLPEVIADGGYYGMQTFDQALFGHLKSGRVTMEEAVLAASTPHDFKLLVAADGKKGTTMEDVADAETRRGPALAA